MSPDTKTEEMLVDESACATGKQVGDALTELEVNGHFFGESSLSRARSGTRIALPYTGLAPEDPI